MKNYLKIRIILIGLVLLLFNCQTDDDSVEILNQDILTSKSELTKKNEGKLQNEFCFNGSLEWNKAFIENKLIYVPINDADLSFVLLDENNNKTKKEAKLIPFLIIQMENFEIKTENIKIFIDFKKIKKLNKNELLKLHYIIFNQKKEIVENSFYKTFNNKSTLSKSSNCQLWGVYEITTYYDGSTSEELLYTYDVCSGSDITEEQADDSDGGGETNDASINDIPPSCKSFNFTRVGNYQYSYVKGIRFLVIDSNGNSDFIKYDNPIEFGAPYLDRFGNVFGIGALAESSALALQDAMDNTKDYLKNRAFTSQGEMERYFEAELIRLYAIYIPGARAKIRPTDILSPISTYQTSGISIGVVNFGTDNCN